MKSNNMEEIWKDIKDYPNYMVSSMGRVKSLGNDKTRKEKILKPVKNNYGYLNVVLHNNGKRKMITIHRLVAEAFIENLDGKPIIDHINTIRDDNRVENLRYCTYKENSNNLETKNNLRKALKGINSISILQLNKETGEVIREWSSAIDAQKEYGIANGNIGKCCKGKLKSTGGYKWRYKESVA